MRNTQEATSTLLFSPLVVVFMQLGLAWSFSESTLSHFSQLYSVLFVPLFLIPKFWKSIVGMELTNTECLTLCGTIHLIEFIVYNSVPKFTTKKLLVLSWKIKIVKDHGITLGKKGNTEEKCFHDLQYQVKKINRNFTCERETQHRGHFF